MTHFQKIIQLTRPTNLVFTLLTYGLGLGIARYLGSNLYPLPEVIGGVYLVLVMAASSLLTEYFRPVNEKILPDETRKERNELGTFLMTISLGLLGTAGALLILLRIEGFIHLESFIFLLLFMVLALMNAVPPIRLVNRGLGEFSNAILIASFSPTIAFLLQYGKFNRILTIYTFPLLFLALAYFLSLDFPAFSEDLKYERKTMLMSLTWQKSVPLHNVILIAAYLIFASIPFLGLPLQLVWPALLGLPLAAFQVFTLRNIADGIKPNWPVFVAVATAIFAVTVYSLTLAFWLR